MPVDYCSDKKGEFNGCRQVLEELGQEDPSDEDCANVRFVCEAVSRRAAHIAAAGVATLLNKMGESHVTVAVDGSVYRFHPHFHDLMVDKIRQLINPGLTVTFFVFFNRIQLNLIELELFFILFLNLT